MGELNLYIKNDTLFKNRNKYNSLYNKLEFTILDTKELDSIKFILNSLVNNKLVSSNKKQSEYESVCSISFIFNNKRYEFDISEEPISKRYKDLYLYLKKLSYNNKRFDTINNKLYEQIKILGIKDIEKKKNIEFRTKLKRSKVEFKIWLSLMNSKSQEFQQTIDTSNFKYMIDFSYLINSRDSIIQKMYLDSNNNLAIKFSGKRDYQFIKQKSLYLKF